jgi:hypothetical protein
MQDPGIGGLSANTDCARVMLGRWLMNQIGISRKLFTAAACACRFAGVGSRAGVPGSRRRPAGACLLAVAAVLLAAFGAAGVSRSAALASSSSVLDWTKQSPATHPPARSDAAMAYDAATGKVVTLRRVGQA